MKRFSRSHPPVRPQAPRRAKTLVEPAVMDTDTLTLAFAQAIKDTQSVGAPEPAPTAPTQTKWQRRANWLRGHPVVVIMEAIGLVGLIFAVGLFIYELRERQDERTARSWQLLTAVAPGNSGKIEALAYLNSQYGCLPNWVKINWCWKVRTSLQGIDLSRETHRDAVFLIKVDLSGAMLQGANLTGTALGDANLSGAVLDSANLSDAELGYANLSGAVLGSANLSGAVLEGANLSGAVLEGANLSSAILWDANLSGAKLLTANLSDAKLGYANLFGAELGYVNLSDADLADVNLSGAYLLAANLSDAKLWFANLSGADLRIANLSGANLLSIDTDQETNLRAIWAYENAPPTNAPPQIENTIAVRKKDETWPVFVDRIIEEHPELNWTEADKVYF